jgi:hypothetical protein
MRTSKSTHYPIRKLTSEGTQLTTTNGVGGTAVHRFEIGGVDDLVQSIQIAWPDATSNATIVLQSSNFLLNEATETEAAGFKWSTEPVTITGPVGSAAGSTMVHLGNCGARRMRLEITVSATTQLYILGHGKQ